MSSLIIDHRDVSLDYEHQCLQIRQPEQPLRSIPLNRLQRILCMHNVSVSTRLLGHCQKLGVDFIVLNNRYSDHSFALHADHINQAERRLQQYLISSQQDVALPLATRLVRHKLAQVVRILRRSPTEPAAACIEVQLQAAQRSRASLSLEQLRGIEGAAQRALFDYWRQALAQEWNFKKRQRRPPPDPVNALLSLSFQLAHHEAIRQCLAHGLDPWLGIYHQLAPGRMSLACDLMEPLRPHIEAWVIQLLSQGELDRRHFNHSNGTCLLGKTGRERYYALWHAQLPHWSRKLKGYAALFARYLTRTHLS